MSKNVIFKKKSLDNGDISKHMVNTLGSKALSALKKEKEIENYKKDLKKVKKDQKNLSNTLKNIPFTQKFPKLPINIEENEELVSLLLKDPDLMTPEEKNYIQSFNKDEFKRFMTFLNNKKKEQKWQGNGYGSGKYLDNFSSIHSKDFQIKNEKAFYLKNYLKMSYNNQKAKSNKKSEENETNKNELYEKTQNIIYKEESMNSDQASLPIFKIQDTTFENSLTTKQIMKELEKFNKILCEVKTDITMKKHEGEKNLIIKEIDDKKNILHKDLERIRKAKIDDRSDIDKLYEKYKLSIEQSKENKIRNYITNTNLTPVEFVKIIDKTAFSTNLVDLDTAEKSLIKLNILNEEQSKYFFKNLKKFYPSKLALEKFVHFIEIDADYVPVFPEEDTAIIEEEVEINTKEMLNKQTSVCLDNEDNQIEEKKVEEEEEIDEGYRKSVLNKRKIKTIESVKRKKSVKLIQRIYKGHLMRRIVKVMIIRQFILVKRIQKRARKFILNVRVIRNQKAYKIYYFLLKQSQRIQYIKELGTSSRVFLKNKDPSRNFAAYFIQGFWRQYRDTKMKLNLKTRNISQSLIKSKICLFCKKFRVTKLCSQCDINHYCDTCFEKFHSHGIKRNHEYSKIVYDTQIQREFSRERKATVRKIFTTFKDDAEELSEMFKECDFNVLEHIRMWDHDKKGIISNQMLKEAFSFKFFNFGTSICETILNLSYRFSLKHNKFTKNEEIMIDYVEMCKTLFNQK